MEVERSTDDAGGADRDAAVLTAVGPTDTTTTSSTDTTAADAGMDVTGPVGTAGAGAKVQRHRAGKQAGMTSNQRKRLRKLKAREQDK